jgi:hypothetical protein
MPWSGKRPPGRILQVGLLERFNPAVTAAAPLVNGPMFFEAHRLSVFHRRALDVDVVLDLMIHDLDIVLSFVRSPVRQLHAVGLRILSPKVDIANVRLEFASGCVANFTASRVSTETVRKLRFFQPHQYLSIDYARQDLLLINVAAPMAGHDGAPPPSAAGCPASRRSRAGNPCCWRSRLSWIRFVPANHPGSSPGGPRCAGLGARDQSAIQAHASRAGLPLLIQLSRHLLQFVALGYLQLELVIGVSGLIQHQLFHRKRDALYSSSIRLMVMVLGNWVPLKS